MPHRDDGLDAGIADIDHGTPQRHRFGADRHAAEIGVEIDAGIDRTLAGAERRADFLPVVTIALFDRRARRRDQFLVRAA